MDPQFINEIARLLNLPPLVILYLTWLGHAHFKKNKQLDTAFNKIRALESRMPKTP